MHTIKVRGVIRKENQIFLVRERNKHFYYLPGGTLEQGESFKACLKREILEELGVQPIIGEILNVREFKTDQGFYLDVWFDIKNSQDFEKIDTNKATHAFEYYDEGFYAFDELAGKDVRPGNIEEILGKRTVIEIIG